MQILIQNANDFQHFDYKPYGASMNSSTGHEAKQGFTGNQRGFENRYIQLGASISSASAIMSRNF